MAQSNKEQRVIEIIVSGQQANASIKEMSAAAAIMSNQLKKMAADDPGRDALIKQLQELKSRLKDATDEVNGIDRAQKQAAMSTGFMNSGFMSLVKTSAIFSGVAMGIEGIVSSIKALGQESINSAARTSDSLADIQKSSGLTKAEVAALNEELKNIDTRTTQEALQGIAIVGGQIGVAKDELEAFTVATDKAVVALGDEFSGGAEEVARSMGSLQKLFKETKDLGAGEAINKIGSAINALGAAGTATGPVVADFAQRIGQLGDLAPQISQTLGLGAAFQELGLTAEISAGGLSNILLTAAKGTGAFAQQIGITEEAFKKLINSNPNEVILRLAESLEGASNTEIVQTLDSLDIKSQEATKVMSLLASKTDFVREKQSLASVEMEKATSLTDEFNIKNNTLAAQIEKSDKQFAQLKDEIGQGLAPVYIKIVAIIGTFISILRGIPKFISDNKIALMALVLGVATFNKELIISNALALKDIAVKQVQVLWNSRLMLATRSLNATMAANPIGAIVTVVALLAIGFQQLYSRSEAVRAGVSGVWNAFKELLSIAGDIALFLLNPIKNAGKIKEIMNAGTRLGEAFSQGYNEKIKEEQAKQEKEEKQKHEKDKKIANQKGEDLGKATADGFAASLKKKSSKQLEEMLATETDEAHKKLIQKEIKFRDELEKQQKVRERKHKEQQVKLKKAREDFDKAEAKAAQELAQLKVDAMDEGIDKEIAKLRLKHGREKAELEKQRQAELANIAATQEEKLAIAAMYDEKERLLAEELRKAEEATAKEYREKQAETIREENQRAQDEYFAALDAQEAIKAEKAENAFLAEQEAADGQLVRTLEAEFERDEALLELKRSTAETKLATLDLLGQSETMQAEKLKGDLLRIDKELKDTQIKNEEKLAKVKYDLARKGMDIGMEAFKVGMDLLSKDTEARKLAAGAYKTFALGKIAVDLAQEIQGIWRNANSNALNALIPGWGPIYAGIQTAGAVLRARNSAKEVTAQQFFTGGMTSRKGKLIPMTERNGMWEMASGFSGGSIGTFADGGMVNDARLGLIGERGAELVIPNWMIRSPKYANTIGWLESERQRGVTALATGGPTTSEPVAVPQEVPAGLSPGEQAILGAIMAMHSTVQEWPTKLQVHNNVVDADKKLQEYYDLQDQASG